MSGYSFFDYMLMSIFFVASTISVGLIFLIGYILVNKIALKKNISFLDINVVKKAVFTSYLFMVLYITIFSRISLIGSDNASYNLELFTSYSKIFKNFYPSVWIDIVLNIVMFIPLGVMLTTFWKKFRKFFLPTILGFMLSFMIESIQFVSGIGAFDLDDLFNNTLGTLLGFFIAMSLLSVFSKTTHKLRKIILYLIPLFIVIIFFYAIYLGVFY